MANNSNDQRYEIEYKPDGVYLKAYSCEAGQAMNNGELLGMLHDKGVDEIDFDAVGRICAMGDGYSERIAPPQSENYLDDSYMIKISDDNMEATLTLLKGEGQGKKVEVQEIISCLKTVHKITRGIDEDSIRDAIDGEKYNEVVVVAKGTPAVDGTDGQVDYHFETNYRKFMEEEDGRVDYKKVNVFSNVSRGDIIATKTSPVPGVNGIDLFGNVVEAKEAKEANFQYGKNVFLSSDGASLLAGIDGKVDVNNGRVVISKVYTVNGNVDMAVGNLDFNGDIVITGNVMAGFEVKAGGSVEIYGVVEGAQIVADGNIRVFGSFLGNGRGMLNAGGNVVCKCVEQGIIRAGGNIEADVVMHSNLWCNESIIVNGEKSSVMGGNLRSGKEMIFNNVGNAKGTLTTLTIELPDNIFQQIGKIEEDNKKLSVILKSLEGKKAKMLTSSDVNVTEKVKLMNSILNVQKSLEKTESDKENLLKMVENVKKAKIEIRGRGFNGVEIHMDNHFKEIDFTVDYTTFVVREGEIVGIPCK